MGLPACSCHGHLPWCTGAGDGGDGSNSVRRWVSSEPLMASFTPARQPQQPPCHPPPPGTGPTPLCGCWLATLLTSTRDSILETSRTAQSSQEPNKPGVSPLPPGMAVRPRATGPPPSTNTTRGCPAAPTAPQGLGMRHSRLTVMCGLLPSLPHLSATFAPHTAHTHTHTPSSSLPIVLHSSPGPLQVLTQQHPSTPGCPYKHPCFFQIQARR